MFTVPGVNPEILYAPPDDRGQTRQDIEAGQLVLAGMESQYGDYEIVRTGTEDFMSELHGSTRHSEHNRRILDYLDEYSQRDPLFAQNQGPGEYTNDPIRLAVTVHDFVEHTILNPGTTANKQGCGDEPDELKTKALAKLQELHNTIKDKDSLEKAVLFSIDASKWETAVAQTGRFAAAERVRGMFEEGEIDGSEHLILRAAIENNRDILQDERYKDRVGDVLKRHSLLDLDLETISEGTLKYNLEGLILKGVETLDILRNPPADNPASTYRDCIEVLNFFVPALTALGFKKLAADLRGSALEFFYDDVNDYAQDQRQKAVKHFDDIKKIVSGVREGQFGGLDIDEDSRIKTEGSMREKRYRRQYEDSITMVPDGVGFAFIVPDGTSRAEIEMFGEAYRQELMRDPRFIAKHPNSEPTFEFKEVKRDEGSGRSLGGYSALNMNFYYQANEGSGDEVSFEIQVMTREQADLKLYGKTSDLLYKAGKPYDPDKQEYFDNLRRRAQAVRETLSGSTIYSITELVATSPEIPSVFNELFRVIEMSDGGRIMAPIELEDKVKDFMDKDAHRFESNGELTILPPTHVTEKQLLRGLKMLNPKLATDPGIWRAILIAKDAEEGAKRGDGKTGVLEGHIFGVALATAMLATQSGQQWESDSVNHHDFIANRVIAAILHDYVEKAMDDVKDGDQQITMRVSTLFVIKTKFGDEIRDAVDALTLPVEIGEEKDRREANAIAIFGVQDDDTKNGNDIAKDVKTEDRLQNHVSDLFRLVNKGQNIDGEAIEWIYNYFRKSDNHLSPRLIGASRNEVYRRQHKLIWLLAESLGYQRYKPMSGE